MSKVHILPAEIISKIAAGEVIERPASVVKELLENALDAQSKNIEVQLQNAGKSSIRIRDNGTGIQEDDLEKIFSRHATSKISSLEDLYNINSLGFRGEALYSIAAVSDVTVFSKTAQQDLGWQIHLRGNQILSKKPVTINQGTEIDVQELFFNTPARKKFLKSNTAELNHILDIFIPYTLLYPQISFVLIHNNNTVVKLTPASELIPRITQALHLEKKHIIEGKKEFPGQGLSLHLVLGDINIQRTRKDMQFIFVNNRPVQNRTISFHLNEIYRLLFSRGVYPFFCAYIKVPAQNLDVNVHPTKREVKIKDELELVSRMRPFCENLLMTQSKAKQAQKQIFSIPDSPIKLSVKTDQDKPQNSILEEDNLLQKQSQCEQYRQTIKQNLLLFKTDDIFVQKKDDLKEKLRTSRYLGNLLKKYLLFETPDSLLVIDQHAAQERITFEKLKSQLESGSVEVQHLATPVLIKLSAQESLMWQESQKNLSDIGFESTLFDKETLALHSHPRLVTDPEICVRNLLSGENIAKSDMETLARRACRSSVMAGFSMNKEQAQYQLDALLECKDPFICPHGRPTIVEIPEPSLSKQFLRK